MNCVNCGTELSPSTRFCHNCGTPVAPPNHTVEQPIYCTSCGKQLSSTDCFCPDCGAKIGSFIGDASNHSNSIHENEQVVNVDAMAPEKKQSRRWWLWILIPAILIGIGVGVFLLISNSRKHNDYYDFNQYLQESYDDYEAPVDEDYDYNYYYNNSSYDDNSYDSSTQELLDALDQLQRSCEQNYW